jgi:dTDP-4-dehydrorhamnose 3,5-epimerase
MSELNIGANKDAATVTSVGTRLEKLIEGVVVRRAITHGDERGELSEIYSKSWALDNDPVEYAYMAMIRPGRIKGWVYHKHQWDRQAVVSGFAKYVLWDARANSPTHGMVNEIFLSERNRGLIMIPPFVVHAVQNVGQIDTVFINLPTVPYNHADPDKYRVPPENVPYSFEKGRGW